MKLTDVSCSGENVEVSNYPFLAASAPKKFTLVARILQLVLSAGITIFRTMLLSYVYVYIYNIDRIVRAL